MPDSFKFLLASEVAAAIAIAVGFGGLWLANAMFTGGEAHNAGIVPVGLMVLVLLVSGILAITQLPTALRASAKHPELRRGKGLAILAFGGLVATVPIVALVKIIAF